MGIVPQTVGNGLKPYGLIYDLVKNHKIHVKWVINPAKTKDGVDFSHNGIDYRGGTFIIPFEFRTPAINAVIASWESQGVVGNTAVSDFTADVYKTISYVPKWTLDKFNGMVAVDYFVNAGIPSTAYGGDSSAWKTPAQLDACDDIFVMPHADPTWATHQNLYYWNLNHKGNLWAGCHAVSALENLTSPDLSIQMNFLSTNGIVPTELHKKTSSPPFLYAYPTDGPMQFMRNLDGATINGSERVFLPVLGGNWRPTTRLGVYDLTDSIIPLLSNGPGAIVAYGRAFGDDNRGWVMYQAGHSLVATGTVAVQVSAQRAFFNYSYDVCVDRFEEVDPVINGMPELMITNEPVNLSLSTAPSIDLSKYTIKWTSSAGGSFSPNDSEPNVTFTPPSGYIGNCIITVSLTDGCGTDLNSSSGTYINSVLETNLISLSGKYDASTSSAKLNWEWAESNQISHFEVERSSDGQSFQKIGVVINTGYSETNSFSYSDLNLKEGNYYYRLRVTQANTPDRFSNIIRIGKSTVIEKKSLIIYENPVRNSISFGLESNVSENITVQLFDYSGRQVMQKAYKLEKGFNRVNIGSIKPPPGVYLLRVLGRDQKHAVRLMIH